MPTNPEQVTDYTRELLSRPTVGQVRFSDVYPETAGLDTPQWWRYTDYDAALTDRVESGGFSGVTQIPIGLRPWMTRYGLLLTDDLVTARNERVDALTEEGSVLLNHPDVDRERQEREGAVVVLANKAHRDNSATAGGRNGHNFYLAITESGTEFYVTPSAFLGDLEHQGRITALYEIPNEDHPEFNGDAEQFRSARVTRTRRHPDHLVRVFDYEGDREALLQAKEDGTHPEAIPLDPRQGRIAHVDKFGNVILWVADSSGLAETSAGRLATLTIASPAEGASPIEVRAVVSQDLKSAPLGKLAIYGNCSSHDDQGVSGGLVELITRVDDDPNTSEDTAFFQLLKRTPNIADLAEAEIVLRAGKPRRFREIERQPVSPAAEVR